MNQTPLVAFLSLVALVSYHSPSIVVADEEREFSAVLYVSNAGDDSNSGTSSAPFATLSRARDAARELREEIKDGWIKIQIQSDELTLVRSFSMRAIRRPCIPESLRQARCLEGLRSPAGALRLLKRRRRFLITTPRFG